MELQGFKQNHIFVRISALLLFFAVIAKQFYIGDSGSLQFADLFFVASAGFSILAFPVLKQQIGRDDWLLLLYLGCIVVINVSYFLIFRSSDYLLFTAYYVYAVLITIAFSLLMKNASALKTLSIGLQIAMAVQACVFLFKLGDPYTGSFNDTNQCAFFAFSCFLLIYMINIITGFGNPLIWLVLGLYIDIMTGSMGSFLGFCVFAYVWLFVRAMKLHGWKRILILGTLIVAALGVVLLIFLVLVQDVFQGAATRSIAQRLSLKFGRLLHENGSFSFYGFIADRKMWLVVDNPLCMLYGAGEGYFSRFGSTVEVHNSILGPLFYYGVIPWSIWILWYIKKVRRIKPELICVYVALAVESFVLMNCRQPLFWMILVLAGHEMAKKTVVEVAYESNC